jgi:hypothetical protein
MRGSSIFSLSFSRNALFPLIDISLLAIFIGDPTILGEPFLDIFMGETAAELFW